MEHRIQFSATLLMAIRTGKTTPINIQPKVAGTKISAKPATIWEKGTHAVNALGNIVVSNGKKEVAA